MQIGSHTNRVFYLVQRRALVSVAKKPEKIERPAIDDIILSLQDRAVDDVKAGTCVRLLNPSGVVLTIRSRCL